MGSGVRSGRIRALTDGTGGSRVGSIAPCGGCGAVAASAGVRRGEADAVVRPSGGSRASPSVSPGALHGAGLRALVRGGGGALLAARATVTQGAQRCCTAME